MSSTIINAWGLANYVNFVQTAHFPSDRLTLTISRWIVLVRTVAKLVKVITQLEASCTKTEFLLNFYKVQMVLCKVLTAGVLSLSQDGKFI